MINENLIDDLVNEFSVNVNKKDDLNYLLKICLDQNRSDLFDKLAFQGKYVNGLFKVLKSSSNIPEVQNIDQIKKDLNENIQKVISLIREITLLKEDESTENINSKYLQINTESFKNLQQIIEDLDSVKKYLNQLKRD